MLLDTKKRVVRDGYNAFGDIRYTKGGIVR